MFHMCNEDTHHHFVVLCLSLSIVTTGMYLEFEKDSRFTCNRHVLTRFVCTYIGMFLFFIHHHIACIASHSIARPAERLVISPKHKIACYTNCPISNSRGLITHASIDSFLSYTDDIILCFTFSTFRLKNPTAIVIS